MGNTTNAENWAARERLRWIEVNLWWRGWVGRGDLREMFGISAAQSSSDLQRYQELNPRAMAYQTSRKRYESSPRMRCCLHEPDLSDGLALLSEGEGGASPGNAALAAGEVGDRLAVITLPKRSARRDVERRIVLAALRELPLTVHYHSLTDSEVKGRRILPRNFGWDGRRWHTRAWDVASGEWRDFVLGRFEKADWPSDPLEEEPPRDEAWERWETVSLRVNPKLKESAKKSLRMDYGIENEVLEVRVREAMRPYLLAELFLDDGRKTALPNHFVLQG